MGQNAGAGMESAVDLQHGEDGILVATMNLPGRPMNVVGDALLRGIALACEKLADTAVKGLILTSAKSDFCAGGDLDRMSKWTMPEEPYEGSMAMKRVLRQMELQGKPVVAAINGHALGGGLEIALAADIRIAGRGARLGAPEVKRGWLGGGGASQLLPRLVGIGQASLLLLAGEPVDAERALAIGLVEEVVDDAAVAARAEALARAIAAHSPIATQAVKAALRAALSTPLEAGLRYENELHVLCMQSEDRREGIAAFREKRDGSFAGR